LPRGNDSDRFAAEIDNVKNLHGDIAGKPHEADIRAALDRIVSSPDLSKSPQLASFLRFVVDATLAGHGRKIKAYTIATDALGRDADFDPQTDPIVRVEAGRLRRAMLHYYANGGGNDPLVIELPRGSYVPVFRPSAAPRRAIARISDLRREIAATVRDNYRLLLVMVALAATVSLTVEVLERAVWPRDETATRPSPPGFSSPANLGNAAR